MRYLKWSLKFVAKLAMTVCLLCMLWTFPWMGCQVGSNLADVWSW